MKKFIKILMLAAASVLMLSCFVCSGCILTVELGGDEVCYYRLALKESDGGYYLFRYEYAGGGDIALGCECVEVDPVNCTYTEVSSLTYASGGDCNIVACGNTSGDSEIYVAESCSPLYGYLMDEGAVIDCLGWADGDTVTGICNGYKTGSTLNLVIGNQNRIDKVNRLIVFNYSISSAEYNVIYCLDGAVGAALSGNTLIYLKDNNFYSCDITTGEASFLSENYAIANNNSTSLYSTSNVLFNDEYAYFNLFCWIDNSITSYKYLYNFTSGTFSALTAA